MLLEPVYSPILTCALPILISLESIHQNITEMYPVLLKYWCSMAIFKALHSIWYLIPFGFVLFPAGLVALNKEAYSTLKRHQLQKAEHDSKTVAASLLSRCGWYSNVEQLTNTESYIFGDLSLKIATLLEKLSVLPDIMTPLYDSIESIVSFSKTKTFPSPEKDVKEPSKSASEPSFYKDYDLMEDIIMEFKASSTTQI